MGRVFVARDLELERSVAVKVLVSASRDAEDDLRLEQEARAAGSLNHPNILVVHDIGRGDDGPYIVSELLEGETLRQRLGGKPLPLRKALDFAAQLARGLAAAHEKGLVHRDIKPENIFITRDGRLKILDFGVAKVVAAPLALTVAQDEAESAGRLPRKTEPGAIIGTVVYMSPEQVRGRRADHRSDLFSAGIVLYEMLAGRPPFAGSTSIETAWAIVNGEPAPLPSWVPPALERLVFRCLEKEPAERFQSARDLAFHLEALQLPESRGPEAKPHRGAVKMALFLAAACALAFAAGSLGVRLLSRRGAQGRFRQITFIRGFVGAARFAPDGETVVYSHAEGSPPELFTLRLDRPNARPVGLKDANLLAISHAGELAVLLHPQFTRFDYQLGTLGRVPFGGGAVREIAEGIQYADWDARDELALVRAEGARTRLEFPAGHVLYETPGWISHPRFSPQGDQIAFLDHPDPTWDDGNVDVVDLEGNVRTLAAGWKSVQGLAWSPGGKEIWFTGAANDVPFSQNVLRAVDLSGKQRVVAEGTGRLKLEDISAGGRVVLTKPDPHLALVALPDGASVETDLSLLELPILNDLSRDGSMVLVTESGSGAQRDSAMFVRKTDGSPPLALGVGRGLTFSSDGKWVLAVPPPQERVRQRVSLIPIGAGEARVIETGEVAALNGRLLPGGNGLVFVGKEPGHASRLYTQKLDEGDPRPISEEGVSDVVVAVSADGTQIAAVGPGGQATIYPLRGGSPLRLRGMEPGEQPLGFGPDGALFIRRRVEVPAKIHRIDPVTHARTLWKTLLPRGVAVNAIGRVAMSADAKSFAYNYADLNAHLFLLEGLE